MSSFKNKLSLKTVGLVYPFEYDFTFLLFDIFYSRSVKLLCISLVKSLVSKLKIILNIFLRPHG